MKTLQVTINAARLRLDKASLASRARFYRAVAKASELISGTSQNRSQAGRLILPNGATK